MNGPHDQPLDGAPIACLGGLRPALDKLEPGLHGIQVIVRLQGIGTLAPEYALLAPQMAGPVRLRDRRRPALRRNEPFGLRGHRQGRGLGQLQSDLRQTLCRLQAPFEEPGLQRPATGNTVTRYPFEPALPAQRDPVHQVAQSDQACRSQRLLLIGIEPDPLHDGMPQFGHDRQTRSQPVDGAEQYLDAAGSASRDQRWGLPRSFGHVPALPSRRRQRQLRLGRRGRASGNRAAGILGLVHLDQLGLAVHILVELARKLFQRRHRGRRWRRCGRIVAGQQRWRRVGDLLDGG